MNLLQIIIIFYLFVSSDAYIMLWSICKAVFTTIITDLQYISIEPMKNHSSTDVSLIILRGSNIKSRHYIGISKTIQNIGKEKGLNIDIKIPHFPMVKLFNNIHTPKFVLGHSSGAYDFLLFNNISKYDGFIQIGSVLNSNGKLPWKSRKLEEFPIPIMTLIGQKDGYLRHTYCLDELYNQNETEKYKTKPIIILKDITHLHISNTSSSNIANLIGLKDLKSTMNIHIAWNMIAMCIVDFIILNSNCSETDHKGKDQNNSVVSLKRMRKIQSETRSLLHTYLKFDNIKNLKELLSILHMFLNYKQDTSNSDVYFLNYYDFILSKPTDNTMYFHKEHKNVFSQMYFTPLWVKTKYKIYLSASKINKFIFQQMSNKYHYDRKVQVVFKADKICSTTLEWILTSVSIEKNNNTIYIQSPVFITNDDSVVYKNFYYMKILSPVQILELINIDLQDY